MQGDSCLVQESAESRREKTGFSPRYKTLKKEPQKRKTDCELCSLVSEKRQPS